MGKENGIFDEAYKWSTLRPYRQVLGRFVDAAESNMTEAPSRVALSELFGDYYAVLKTESAKYDKPENEILRRLAAVTNPKIFLDINETQAQMDLSLLGRPLKSTREPLYGIAREVQDLAPGVVFLRDAQRLFDASEIPQNISPAVLEYAFDIPGYPHPKVARVPLLLTGMPGTGYFVENNIPVIDRVVSLLKVAEQKVAVEVHHLPYLRTREKDIEVLKGAHPVLEWPFAYPQVRSNNTIVAALKGDPTLEVDHSEFAYIKITAGEASETWAGSSKGIFGYMPDGNVTKWWSLNNTVYQARNIGASNMLKNAKRFAADIFSIRGVQFTQNASVALLGVHMPILTAAAYTQTIAGGVEVGLREREDKQNKIDAQRRRDEERFWDTYSF